MEKNPLLKRIPFALFVGSSLFALISEFIPWGINVSAFSFILLLGWSFSNLFYLFPFFSGICIICGGLFLQFPKKVNKIIIYIVLLFGMNMTLIFLFEMIDLNGPSLFHYPGVYCLIVSIILLLFGLIYQFSSPIEKIEDLEIT